MIWRNRGINAAMLILLIAATPSKHIRAEESPLELRDGDRITLIGGTFVERLQSDGYFETLLTSSFPDRDFTLRNLGWSGDDVWGTARAVFGTQADGFRRLKSDLALTKPTVVILAYGGNEANAGGAGLDKFVAGLNRLIDELQTLKARLVLLCPPHRENLGPPLPNPTKYNRDLAMYRDTLSSIAKERGLDFIDFYRPLGKERDDVDGTPAERNRLTDEGLHFNPYGQWRAASHLAEKFGAKRQSWRVSIDVAEAKSESSGTDLTVLEQSPVKVTFQAKDQHLPAPAPPRFSPRESPLLAEHGVLKIKGLKPGKYGLRIGDQPAIAADDKQWAAGVHVLLGKYDKQVEALRSTINAKNELFFHRYRPQNETYLFLFRKHEQGNNAVEVPKFDPLVEKREQEIAKLRVPSPRIFTIVRIKDPADQE